MYNELGIKMWDGRKFTKAWTTVKAYTVETKVAGVTIGNRQTTLEHLTQYDMDNVFVGKDAQNKYNTLRNLKAKASVLVFLENNNIDDMTHLVQKIESINNEYKDIADKVQKVERRLDTLANHFAQYENHKENKAVYNEYDKLKDPKKRDAYYDKHSKEIEAYKYARDYFKAVMNGRTDPVPIKTWQAEQKKLIKSKFALCERYYGLKDNVRSMELLCKSINTIMSEAKEQERQPTRNHGREM